MRYFTILFLLFFVGCSGETPKDLSKRTDQLIAEDKYEQALKMLNNADSSKTDANLHLLKEKTHLNYGIYLEYRGPEGSSMRNRMTSALKQYIAVLKINPDNEKAHSEVQQIMGIYSSMPDRSPGDNILQELRDLGFDY